MRPYRTARRTRPSPRAMSVPPVSATAATPPISVLGSATSTSSTCRGVTEGERQQQHDQHECGRRMPQQLVRGRRLRLAAPP